MRRLLLIVPCLAAVAGCRSEEPAPALSFADGVFVINEGQFGWSNASLDFRPRAGGVGRRGIYEEVNGLPLGDVAQSLVVEAGIAWLVVNNSGRVDALDQGSGELLGSVDGLTSPRCFHRVDSHRAYVTDLYSGRVEILDTEARLVTGAVPAGGWTEEMTAAAGRVFVAHPGGDEVLVLDPSGDSVTARIAVGTEPLFTVTDADGMVWVLCTGGLQQTAPALYRIDPAAAAVIAVLGFGQAGSYPQELELSPDGRTLYWLDDGVAAMPIDAAAVPTGRLVPAEGRNFYGLGVDPATGDIYVADAVDFTRRGAVWRYRPDGALVDSFEAGLIPGAFAFLP